MVVAERYLGTREFARTLGVARVTVIKWIKSGRSPRTTSTGGGEYPTARLSGYSGA